MKFDLKVPCKDCPFIKGSSTNMTLEEGRITDIKEDLENDQSFICHKTIDSPSPQQQHCAGALIYLEKQERPNQMMRIAERLGRYDYKKLDLKIEVID